MKYYFHNEWTETNTDLYDDGKYGYEIFVFDETGSAQDIAHFHFWGGTYHAFFLSFGPTDLNTDTPWDDSSKVMLSLAGLPVYVVAGWEENIFATVGGVNQTLSTWEFDTSYPQNLSNVSCLFFLFSPKCFSHFRFFGGTICLPWEGPTYTLIDLRGQAPKNTISHSRPFLTRFIFAMLALELLPRIECMTLSRFLISVADAHLFL